MALTPERRAELEVLGPETVRIRLRSSDTVAVISGFKTSMTRSDLELWLTEKRIEAETYRRQWWWAIQAFVVAFLATAVVLLSAGVKDQLLATYSFSGAVGWLAGAIAYYSVLFAYQRKTKQRSVAWLPLSVSIAALAGLIWWFHYPVRFDLTLATATLTDAMRPAPKVAPAPVNSVAPVAPAPVTTAAPVAPAPVTPAAPAVNPSFTCTRIGNVTMCSK